MRSLLKLLMIALVLGAALFAAGFVYNLCSSSDGMPAGVVPAALPADAGLKDEWVEIGADDPARLIIRGNKLTWKNYWGESGSCGFTVEDSSFGDGKTLQFTSPAPFGTLEFQMDGERAVLSATITEFDGRGVIVISEFARASEIDAFPADYVSPLAHARNDRTPEPTYVLYGLCGDTELSEYFALLGTPAAETDIDTDAIGWLGYGNRAEVDGLLFGTAAYGSFGFSAPEEGYLLEDIMLTVYDLSYEELRGHLAERYGEPEAEGEEPYAEVNGGAVTWCRFTDGTARVRIAEPSEWGCIEVEVFPAAN